MPEQIEAATFYQVGAGKFHDLPNPLPVSGTITMNLAVFTGRFRVQWTANPPFNGIIEKFLTFATDQDPRQAARREFMVTGKPPFRNLMVAVAIDTGKPDQHFQVFVFLWVKCRLFHAPSLTNPNHRCHDLNQGILPSADKFHVFG